jgi:hypothetical protein
MEPRRGLQILSANRIALLHQLWGLRLYESVDANHSARPRRQLRVGGQLKRRIGSDSRRPAAACLQIDNSSCGIDQVDDSPHRHAANLPCHWHLDGNWLNPRSCFVHVFDNQPLAAFAQLFNVIVRAEYGFFDLLLPGFAKERHDAERRQILEGLDLLKEILGECGVDCLAECQTRILRIGQMLDVFENTSGPGNPQKCAPVSAKEPDRNQRTVRSQTHPR